MKKAISVFLSLLLAFSCFAGVLTFTAQAESVELISNGDFEDLSANSVGTIYGAVAYKSQAKAAEAIRDAGWLRATSGNDYLTLGDLSAYNADTDAKTVAAETEYPLYSSANSVTIKQPDDLDNHVVRMNQTLYQAIDLVDGDTYAFRFKIRTTGTKSFWIRLAALTNTISTDKTNDSTCSKMKMEVLSCTGATYNSGSTQYVAGGTDGTYFTVAAADTWYDVTIIAKVSAVTHDTTANFFSTREIIETDYTLFSVHHNSPALNSSGENGKSYRTAYMMLDDVSVKQYADPIGDPAFYNDNGLIANPNDAATVTTTVGGKETDVICVGDEVTATVNYDTVSGAYALRGWFDEDNVLVTTDSTVTFTATTDKVYTPHIISKNLIGNASFEGYEAGSEELQVNVDATNKVADVPTGEKWGFGKNAGYYGVTTATPVLGADGTTVYVPVARSEWATKAGCLTVSNDKAHSGSNSIKAVLNAWYLIRELDVQPNTNYTISYWQYSPDASNYVSISTVATTYNWGKAASEPPSYTDKDGKTGTLTTAKDGLHNDIYVMYVTLAGGRNLTATDDYGTWTRETFTFNSGSFDTLYFTVQGAGTIYLDDLTLVNNDDTDDSYALETKIVDAKGNAVTNANIYAEATATDYGYGTSVATVSYDTTSGAYDFAGWVDADDKVLSTDTTYHFVTTDEKPIAKLVSRNLLESASFEGYEAGTSLEVAKDATAGTADAPNGDKWGFIKNSGYYGKVWQGTAVGKDGTVYDYPADDGSFDTGTGTITVSDTAARSGNQSLLVSPNYRSTIRKITVSPDTDYVLSFWHYAEKTALTATTITTAYNVGIGADNQANSVSDPTLNAADIILSNELNTAEKDRIFTLSGINKINETSAAGVWQQVTYFFNSGDFETLYLLVRPFDSTVYYLDDLVLMEYEQANLNTDDMKNCASVDLINTTADTLYIGQNVEFRVVDNMETAPTVKWNGTELTADENGVYSFIAAAENALSVRFAGDEDLLWAHKDAQGRALNTNNHAVYSEDIWNGNTVYHETALFTTEKDTVSLLYPVDSVVSLRSYSLAINYVEGYDYKITEDGQIKRLDTGRIPAYDKALTSDEKISDYCYEKADGTGYVVSVGDTTHAQYAVSVTYTHTDTFADGYTPAAPTSQYLALTGVMNKLESGEEVNIVVYGDSISCGWSSSGLNTTNTIYDDTNTEGSFKSYVIHAAPYAPTWIEMLITELETRYPNATIHVKNLSLGGKQSGWGATDIAERLALWDKTPDLMLVGFGVNDAAGNVTADTFKTNMQNIITNARTASNNDALEVLMYSPMLPNQLASNWQASKLLAYETAMQEIANETASVGLVKLTSIFNEIVKSKAPEDYLSTNVNHGNDFTARVYYNAIMAAMEDVKVESVMSDARNSMRAVAGNQALRYKFDVDKAALSATYGSSYQIVEYGYIAIRDKYMDQGDLTFAADGTLNNAKAVYGVAYKKGKKDIVFSQTDTTKTVSVALKNIGLDKETNIVDYAAYGDGYTVLPYFVLQDADGNAAYRYGEAYSASVFATVRYILDESHTEVAESDRTDVQNNVLAQLAQDADATTDKTVSDYYNEWIAAQSAE